VTVVQVTTDTTATGNVATNNVATDSVATGPRATAGASIAWFADVGKADTASVGGKGANLGELVRAGLPVPPGSWGSAAWPSQRATSCTGGTTPRRGAEVKPTG
jgi:pyruvate,water dikinase